LYLGALSEQDLIEILKIKSRERGLSIPSEVIDVILKKSSCNTGNLVKILDHIEERVSRQARRPTVKSVKELVNETFY
jgi:chromosomal replication initiation ATPase DnaA